VVSAATRQEFSHGLFEDAISSLDHAPNMIGA
jgi:hypothetical protein